VAGAAASTEAPSRRALRLALGLTLTFVLAQLIAWPMSFVAPAFATVLLVEAGPQSVRQGLGILATLLAALVGSFFLSYFLLPYPAIMALATALLLFRFYVFAVQIGAPLLALIGMLLGCVLMPVLVLLLPEVAVIAGYGFLASFMVAILVAWTMFLLIPAPGLAPSGGHATMSFAEAASTAVQLTIVVLPLLLAFLIFGWTDILILIYGVLFSVQMSSVASGEAGMKSIFANLLFAGVGMLLVYELLVVVPNVTFMAILILTACLIYGGRIFAPSPTADIWLSGLFGFLLLSGSALLAQDVVAPVKLLDRVVQIALATAYIVFAYRVIDLVKHVYSRRSMASTMPETT
jgi:hypothetical protein